MHLPKFVKALGDTFELLNGKYYNELLGYYLGFKRTRQGLMTTGYKIVEGVRQYDRQTKGQVIIAIAEREYLKGE